MGAFAIIAVMMALPAQADEVTDAMEAARKSYEAGNYNAASRALELASQLLVQKSASGLSSLLPAALPGWTARDFEPSAFKTNVLMASAASRRYVEASGKQVDIAVTGDNALLGQIIQWTSSPKLLGFLGTVMTINGRAALQMRDGDVYIPIDNRYLVSVSGSANADEKLAYANAVDTGAIARLR